MLDEILAKMTRSVYYPGNHLGRQHELDELVEKGYLERADSSFLCGPDSPPNYCLTEKGCCQKYKKNT